MIKAVAEAIIQIICDDLKYRDMQNDQQYIMLNSRLKEEKKLKKNTKKTINKTKPKQEKTKTKHEKRTSKFSAKYKDRIESIQTSDKKREENLKKLQQEKTK